MSLLWQRFTERAKLVVLAAQNEAARMGEPCVSPEQLLIGLVMESESVAGRALERLGVSTQDVQMEMERQIGGGGHRGLDKNAVTLSPRMKRVLDLAYDDARQAKGKYIGTEHLLIGIIRESEGVAFNVLTNLGVSIAAARKEIANCLAAGISDTSEDSSQ